VKFVRYPSIENHYQNKHINRWLQYHPELENETYVLVEKIHGSNFQTIFAPNVPVTFASRNQPLGPEPEFHGCQEVIKGAEYRELINHFQNLSNERNAVVRLYQELFGANIQKGVNYGPKRQTRVFDLKINDLWMSQKDLQKHFILNLDSDFLVPIYAGANSLQEALDFDTRKDSLILGIEDNECEGVVIKPFHRVYESPDGELFYLKKKNESFTEKQKGPKRERELDHPLKAEFLLYINENRLEGIFSKYGRIESPKQIGDYIKYMIEDAKEDFLKDNSVEGLSKNESKEVFSVGYNCMVLLKKSLAEEV